MLCCCGLVQMQLFGLELHYSLRTPTGVLGINLAKVVGHRVQVLRVMVQRKVLSTFFVCSVRAFQYDQVEIS